MFEMGGTNSELKKNRRKRNLNEEIETIELDLEQEVSDARLGSDKGASCRCQQVSN